MVVKRRNCLPIFDVTTIHPSFWYYLPHVPVRVFVDVHRFRPRRVSSHWELKVLKGTFMDVIYNFEPLYWIFFALILIGFGYFELLCIGSPFFRIGIHSLWLLWTVFELFISLVYTCIHTCLIPKSIDECRVLMIAWFSNGENFFLSLK